MDRYLMTQTLLSSWAYTFNAMEGYEDEAMAEFIATLHREKKEPNEYMLNGIEFESLCYDLAAGKRITGKPPKNYEGAYQVAKILQGAPIQVKAQRDIEVGGMTFLLYGILDALKAGTIYDVKFLNKSMGSAELAGKYLESAQHPAYFYLIPEALDFQYLVSDGKDLYIERYAREQTRPIGEIINEFIQSITDMGLLETYKEHWKAL